MARTLFAEDPVELKANWQLYRADESSQQVYALSDGDRTIFTDGVDLFLIFDGWEVIQFESASIGRYWRMTERASGGGTDCLPSEVCEVEYFEFSSPGQLLGSERLGCSAWLVSNQNTRFFKTCRVENKVYDYQIVLDDTGNIIQIDWILFGKKWELRRLAND